MLTNMKKKKIEMVLKKMKITGCLYHYSKFVYLQLNSTVGVVTILLPLLDCRGTVAESGSHEQLMAARGKYYKLWNTSVN